MDHTIPAVARAIEVMDQLSHSGAASIADLTAAMGVPRSTVYRVLNTLEASSMVIRNADGTYRLGPHLLRLARAVSLGSDVVTIAKPFLDRLSTELGLSAKLTILQESEAVVVAVSESRQTYTVGTQVGRRFPLHAGAASKLLLAHINQTDAEFDYGAMLSSFTSSTITDPALLKIELEAIRAKGFSEDRSEYVDGVNAVAAPVFESSGVCIAAVSVPYFSQTAREQVDTISRLVIEEAQAMSKALGAA